MKYTLCVITFALLLGHATDARAERVSIAAGKAVVAIGKVTGRAGAIAPKVAWRGIKWCARHL